MAHMWGTEENLWESVLSFLHVGSKNRSRVVRLGSKRLYPLSHLSSPLFILNLLRANLFLPVCHTLRLKTQCHSKCVRKSSCLCPRHLPAATCAPVTPGQDSPLQDS